MVTRLHVSLLAVVVAVGVVAAFGFVGFAAAEHRTTVDRQVTTASVNDARVTVPDDVVLYVVGPDPLRGHLQDALVGALDERGIGAEPVTELAADHDRPVLMVGIRESDIAYDPVTPSARVALSFEYAPAGNVTQFGRADDGAGFDPALVDEHLRSGDTVPLRLDGENVLFRGGDVRVTDATTGDCTSATCTKLFQAAAARVVGGAEASCNWTWRPTTADAGAGP